MDSGRQKWTLVDSGCDRSYNKIEKQEEEAEKGATNGQQKEEEVTQKEKEQRKDLVGSW